MSALFRFIDVRCEESDHTYAFTMHSGETRLLQVSSREEKNALIDSALGEINCAKGAIEIVQGERRQKYQAVIGKIGERRHNSGPVPLIWQPVSEIRPGRVGWVAANGGLISNLKVWENVTLPLWYHGWHEVADTEHGVMHWLGRLGMEQNAFESFMGAQPHGIESWQRKLAGLLRALMLKSPVLLVDAMLFEDVKAYLANCWISALESYAAEGGAVLAITDKATILSWEKIE